MNLFIISLFTHSYTVNGMTMVHNKKCHWMYTHNGHNGFLQSTHSDMCQIQWCCDKTIQGGGGDA